MKYQKHYNMNILVTKPLVIRRQQHDLVYPAEQFDLLYVWKHLDLEEDHTAQENISTTMHGLATKRETEPKKMKIEMQ